MSIESQELELIATQVWELIMGSQIVPTRPADLSTEVAPRVAYVDLTGAYTGTVALQIDERLIRSAAAEMFGVAHDNVSETEMADTARELANMVGGNVKCLVEQPTNLGLPILSPADEFYASRSAATTKLGFEHEGAPLHVLVYDA